MNAPANGADMLSISSSLFLVLKSIGVSANAVALYTIRFAVALAILPVTAEQIINRKSRTGLAVLLAIYVAAGRPPSELDVLTGAEVALIAFKEAFLGVVMGFAMSTVFWTIEFAGALVDTAAGYNSVQLQNPMSGQQSTPVSNMMGKMAGAVFFAIGGGISMVETLFESFRIWPLTDLLPSTRAMLETFLQAQVSTLFSNTLKLAAPVLTVLVLIDVGIGLLSRSAEKLEPTNLSQPIKGIVAIVLLLMMVGTVFEPLRRYLVPSCVACQMAPPRAASASSH